MSVSWCARIGIAVLALGALSACASDTNGGIDCPGRPDPVATASTWKGLEAAMLDYTARGRVVSVRTQARGESARDAVRGDPQVTRVVDLLNQRGRKLVQAEVRRTAPGHWRADVLAQCTD